MYNQKNIYRKLVRIIINHLFNEIYCFSYNRDKQDKIENLLGKY